MNLDQIRTLATEYVELTNRHMENWGMENLLSQHPDHAYLASKRNEVNGSLQTLVGEFWTRKERNS